MIEVVVITGALRLTKILSDCHRQTTTNLFFCRQDALPVAQPTSIGLLEGESDWM